MKFEIARYNLVDSVSKICFAGKMEKIHSWEKLDSSIPGSGFASQWKSIETSFGLGERERERE